MKKLLLIINPRAGKSEIRAKLLDVIDIFFKGGYEVTVLTTQQPLDAARFAKERAPSFDIIVACGGDGTLSELVNGVMSVENRPLLGYIPSGTTNDFAQSLSLPTSPVEAAVGIMEGVPMPLDVGVFNQCKYFAYVAAFGAFSDISYSTPQNTKNFLGRGAYILEGMKSIPSIRPVKTICSYNGQCIEEDVIIGIVSNSSSVAGIHLMNMPDGSLSDGLLEVTIVRQPKTVAESGEIVTTVLTGDLEAAQKAILTFKANAITFEFARETAWTLDGEYGGAVARAEIGIQPKAISVVANHPELTAE
ncbi:MAG: YegS/Rv2252/BmrU family lipid kinase [Eubacteriaceae bacterium]|jgi:YegS/Rv2252/BmrU family lipid kinase|nr:YegS/Rv2252/BmrU family lipid kinase [Eubacteriaceae bacterium]